MRLELSSLPAIHLGGDCVMPQRSAWDVIASPEELAALERLSEAIAERRVTDMLHDDLQRRVLARSIEIIRMVARQQ